MERRNAPKVMQAALSLSLSRCSLSICMLKAICCSSQRAAQRPSRAYNIPADRAHQKHTRPPHRLCRSVYCKIIIAHCAPAMLNNYLRSAALKPTLVLRDPQQAQRWTRRARGCSPILAPFAHRSMWWHGRWVLFLTIALFSFCVRRAFWPLLKSKEGRSMVVKLTVDAAH